ncbi:MAG TPA: hypothetical protein VJN89_08125 [Candidatus Acidoferrum sp.]|nr:hypothetical protein [Candidatus Acidoferrum sp.]
MHNGYSATSEYPGNIDFDIHGLIGIRLIDPSSGDFEGVSKLLGPPSKPSLTTPEITVRFVEDLSVPGLKFLGSDDYGFKDQRFYLLQRGTGNVQAWIPFDHIGEGCEIVCRRGTGSVPLLMAIIGLTALKRGHVPLHASALVYNGVGILMAGWAHCGKTAALLGFASKGAEFVGEEFVLLNGSGERMHGLVRPLELTQWHFASLAHVRRAVSLRNRCAFRGMGVLHALQKAILGERTQSSLVSRSLHRVSVAFEDRLRPLIAPSAFFGDRVRSSGASVDKIFLFVSHEDEKIEVRQFTPCEMASYLAVLVQYQLTPLLLPYVAYRFAFPGQRNEFLERVGECSLASLTHALRGKENYMVRLPYPHSFPKLFRAIQPLFKCATTEAAGPVHAVA